MKLNHDHTSQLILAVAQPVMPDSRRTYATSDPCGQYIYIYIYAHIPSHECDHIYIIIHAKLHLRSSPKSSSSVISIERCLHRSTNLWGNGPSANAGHQGIWGTVWTSANAGHRRMQDIRTVWNHCVGVLKMREPVKKINWSLFVQPNRSKEYPNYILHVYIKLT